MSFGILNAFRNLVCVIKKRNAANKIRCTNTDTETKRKGKRKKQKREEKKTGLRPHTSIQLVSYFFSFCVFVLRKIYRNVGMNGENKNKRDGKMHSINTTIWYIYSIQWAIAHWTWSHGFARQNRNTGQSMHCSARLKNVTLL